MEDDVVVAIELNLLPPIFKEKSIMFWVLFFLLKKGLMKKKLKICLH
jgi:hypothetical protein